MARQKRLSDLIGKSGTPVSTKTPGTGGRGYQITPDNFDRVREWKRRNPGRKIPGSLMPPHSTSYDDRIQKI